MGIELELDGKEVEVHGVGWCWQRVGIRESDMVTARGVFVSMIEMPEGCREELILFEQTIEGRTYGNAREGIPVWIQLS